MSTKIDIQNPKKYFGKAKGDTELARVAHVNYALKKAEEANGDTFQLDMPYEWYPEMSQVLPSGTTINYNGGPAWVGYKVSGMVVPNGPSFQGSLGWYLGTIRTKFGSIPGPAGIIPYSLTGMVKDANQDFRSNGYTSFSPLAKGALIYDLDNNESVPADNIYVHTATWDNGVSEDGYLYQDLWLMVETSLENWTFQATYQFEYLIPEGSITDRGFY